MTKERKRKRAKTGMGHREGEALRTLELVSQLIPETHKKGREMIMISLIIGKVRIPD